MPRRHGRHARLNRPQGRHPVSAIRATPATQNDRGCEIVPRLLREIKVDVMVHQVPRLPCKVPRRHGRHGRHARLNRAQGRHPVPSVPRLPRKTTVHVRLCYAGHVKSRWMSPSATPATQSAAASRASRATKPGPKGRHPVP